ncbi:MAG TPA: septal ring lytic transglycosylase RlpA family protein [Roseiarcus sp.]|nr:septal ring lytic transglycosylase RlpA family protein [Roseiarcus sp.]
MSVPGFEPRLLAGKRKWRGATILGLSAVALAGCAAQTAQQHYDHGHEHFSQAKYGHASPKVVADGQPVPRGGGQYLVGRPYTIAGHTYYPSENASYSAVGMASWYGAAFHGRRTANGEVYDMASFTAAHPTMPLPSYARVTNLGNGYSIIVRVNDRGPYHGGRVMDVSSRVADVLDIKGAGTARVKVEYVGPAPMEGSDDSQLLASLRTDGSQANMIGYSAPVMMAAQAETIWSFFSGGRGAQGRQQEAAPVEVASGPAPEPQPEPVRVAAVAQEPAAETPHAPQRASAAIRQPSVAAPLPPSRPFDLGINRRAVVVVAAGALQPQHVVMPPRRPDLHASAEKALYFSDPAARPLKPMPADAFDRLKIKSALAED